MIDNAKLQFLGYSCHTQKYIFQSLALWLR